MVALRRNWRRPRGVRVAGVIGVAVLAVGGVAACDPTGVVSSATVSYTTDQLVTKELNRQKADVSWLTCTATYDNGDRTPSSSVNTVATVDCDGKTRDGKDITVKGKVTRTVSGACARRPHRHRRRQTVVPRGGTRRLQRHAHPMRPTTRDSQARPSP